MSKKSPPLEAKARPAARHWPPEILGLLISLLDGRTASLLGAACRSARAVLLAHRRFLFGAVRLSPMQLEIRDRALAMPDATTEQRTNVFHARAPMGFGKTICALALAFAAPNDGHRYVYVVPAAAFDTWIHEVTKVFGKGTRKVSPATRVVFAHSSVAAHDQLVKRALAAHGLLDRQARSAGSEEKHTPVLGPNVRALVTTTMSRDGHALAALWGTRAVADEAHAATWRTQDKLANFRWLVTLSANETDFGEVSHFSIWGRISVAGAYMDGRAPVAASRYLEVPPCTGADFDEARAYMRAQWKDDAIRRNLDFYLGVLGSILAGVPRGQVALYLPDGGAGEALASALPRVAAGWEIFSFVNAISKIDSFLAKGRALLVIHHARCVSINLRASHLIFVRPDWVNPIRYAQLVGRTLRPYSERQTVEVCLVAPSGVPILRTVYAEALRRLLAADVPLAPIEFRAAEFAKADACLRLCGSELRRAAPAEVAAALGAAADEPSAAVPLLKHWAASPELCTISAAQMRCLLGLSVE